MIYRVAQEALTNAGRHAGPGSVEVELDARSSGAVLRVRDDGSGFDPAADERAAGSGWRAWPSAPGWWAASSTCAPPPGRAPSSR